MNSKLKLIYFILIILLIFSALFLSAKFFPRFSQILPLNLNQAISQNYSSPNFSTSISEIDLLATESFRQFLDLSVSLPMVDNNGAASRNQAGFLEVSAQRVADKMIMRGIADSDSALIERGVKAIEYGFSQQNSDGSFKNGLGVAENNPDALEAGTFFLQAVGHSYLLLQSSQYAAEYLPRLDRLKPKIYQALEWLEPYQPVLVAKADAAPNRLVFAALAFGLNGIVLDNKQYQRIGREFIKESLKRQRDDGVFLEHGGGDSSYQAVSVSKLQLYRLYSQTDNFNQQLDWAIIKAVDWEKTKIKPSGEVDTTGNTRTSGCREKFLGQCKAVDYPEVVLSFLYYYQLYDDAESQALAAKIIDYAVKNY